MAKKIDTSWAPFLMEEDAPFLVDEEEEERRRAEEAASHQTSSDRGARSVSPVRRAVVSTRTTHTAGTSGTVSTHNETASSSL